MASDSTRLVLLSRVTLGMEEAFRHIGKTSRNGMHSNRAIRNFRPGAIAKRSRAEQALRRLWNHDYPTHRASVAGLELVSLTPRPLSSGEGRCVWARLPGAALVGLALPRATFFAPLWGFGVSASRKRNGGIGPIGRIGPIRRMRAQLKGFRAVVSGANMQ